MKTKLQKACEYVTRFKTCTSLDIMDYCNTTDPRKYINILTHNGIISEDAPWTKSRSGVRFKTYFLNDIDVKQVDMQKCVLSG